MRAFPLNLATASSIVVGGALLLSSAVAQTSVATDPVGFTTSSLLANSDTRISIPFTRPSEFTGTIASVSGSTITVAASPAWTANQFVYAQTTQPKTYYAIIGPNFATLTGTLSATNGSTSVTGVGTSFTTQVTAGDELLVNGTVATVAQVTSATALTLTSNFIGTTVAGATATFDHSPKEGSYYTVSANTANSLTVNLNGDSLSAVASNVGNTSVTLIPYWTLGTAFPAANAGVSFVASTGSTPRTITTQILLPDLTSAGTDLAASGDFYNFNGNWRLYGQDPGVSYDDTILLPTTSFIVRNTATATTFTPMGSVYMNRISTPLDTQVSTQQDNPVAVNRPANVTLNDLGLIVSGAFTPSISASLRNIKDTLLTFDNTASGTDKASTAFYYYLNNGWRLYGQDPGVDYGSTVLPYGAGFIIRKAANTSGTTAFWQNSRNY